MKIFISDDDKIIRQGLKAIIEEQSGRYEIVGEASDGAQTLDAIKNLKPDVLITDIKMPVMDGVELIKEIEKLQLDISIIVLSGYEEYNYVRESMKHGAKDYLLKPVDNEVLLELLKKTEKDIVNMVENQKKSTVLSEKVAESMEILKERLLLELIKGNEPEIEKLSEHKIPVEGQFIVSIINTNGLYKFKKDIHSNVYSTIRELVKEKADAAINDDNGNNCMTVCVFGDETVLLATGKSLDQVDYEKNIYEALKLLKNNMESELVNHNITLGMSKVFQDIKRIYIAYHQAKLAIQHRFYVGCNKLISYNADECCYASFDERQLDERINLLLNWIDIGESYKTKQAIEQILDKLYGSNIEPRQFRIICSNVIHKICASSQEFKNIADNYLIKDIDIFLNIKEIETFSELKAYISDALYTIVDRISHERMEKGLKVIELAKEYIRKNYSKSISLISISDYVHLNHTYFSELFKNETGKNFVDYLIETRINAAKKLLAKIEIKVYKVGQMVGYDNPVSFNLAFKKVVGISPAEYRKIIK